MATSVRLEGLPDLDRALKKLARQFPDDARRALNRTAQRSATRVRRGVSMQVGLPQRELKNRVQYFRATRARVYASVWVGAKSGIPLAKVSGASMSLSGELRAGRTRTQTFRATMPSGYTGSFVRKPDATHKRRPDGTPTELPIEEPRVRLDAPARPILLQVTREQMSTFYPEELKRLVKRTAKRAASRRSKR